MEIDVEITPDDSNPHAVRDQFAKMILGHAAGFLTTKLVENCYDKIVEIRRHKTA